MTSERLQESLTSYGKAGSVDHMTYRYKVVVNTGTFHLLADMDPNIAILQGGGVMVLLSKCILVFGLRSPKIYASDIVRNAKMELENG